jgi:hypothetical protein
MCRVCEWNWSGTAQISHQNSELLGQKFFESTQVMNASGMSTPGDTPDYYSKPYSWMIVHEVSHVKPEEYEVVVIPENYKSVFFWTKRH